jgi:hypothetical protein
LIIREEGYMARNPLVPPTTSTLPSLHAAAAEELEAPYDISDMEILSIISVCG